MIRSQVLTEACSSTKKIQLFITRNFFFFLIATVLDPDRHFCFEQLRVCVVQEQGVTKRCRLSWLTNSALIYEPKCVGRGGVAGSQPVSTAVHRSPNKVWRSNSIFNLFFLWIIPLDSFTPALKPSFRGFQSIFENSAINSNIQSFNSAVYKKLNTKY